MEKFNNKVALSKALATLTEKNEVFITFFKHGSLEVELYKPHLTDEQQPHERDEVYIIAIGSATFVLEGVYTTVEKGDFLFVPATKEHRFTKFSEDFSTWVLFYGPKGGEKNMEQK